MVCDMAHMSGPARMTPLSSTDQFSRTGSPVETTPQANAHIGGNQVTGFMSGRTAEGSMWNPGRLTFSRAVAIVFRREPSTPDWRSFSLICSDMSACGLFCPFMGEFFSLRLQGFLGGAFENVKNSIQVFSKKM